MIGAWRRVVGAGIGAGKSCAEVADFIVAVAGSGGTPAKRRRRPLMEPSSNANAGSGAEGRIRTTDTGIFSAVLYQAELPRLTDFNDRRRRQPCQFSLWLARTRLSSRGAQRRGDLVAERDPVAIKRLPRCARNDRCRKLGVHESLLVRRLRWRRRLRIVVDTAPSSGTTFGDR